MKVFTCTTFPAAVVVAESPLFAALALKAELRHAGIRDYEVTEGSMIEVDLTREHAMILKERRHDPD